MIWFMISFPSELLIAHEACAIEWGSFIFSHSPPYRKNRPASFNWGKTPTAKFSIISRWEFTSTWILLVIWHNPDSHTEWHFVSVGNVWIGTRAQQNPRQDEIKDKHPHLRTVFMGLFTGSCGHASFWRMETQFNGQGRLTAPSNPAFICTNASRQRLWEETAVTLREHLLGSHSLSLKHLVMSILLSSLCLQKRVASSNLASK